MQIIYLDLAERRAMEVIEAKQGDVGRKFQIVLTDNGEGYYIPPDALLSVWYTGSSGCGNYSHIGDKSAFTVEGNILTVEMIAQMLNVRGGGIMCLRMNRPDGSQIGIWNIQYIAEPVPGEGSEEAQQYYHAFSETAGQLAENVALISGSLSRLDTDFAPSGYGLGMQLGTTTTLQDLNNTESLTGYYNYTMSTANLPNSTNFGGGFVLVENHIADSVVYQTIVNNSPYIICKRRYYNGTWSEWEWLNPPMTQEIEYLTTKRYFGNLVYTKVMYLGFLPQATTSSYKHNITGIGQIVDCKLVTNNKTSVLNYSSHITDVSVDDTNISITTDANLSSTRVYAVLEYCKV